MWWYHVVGNNILIWRVTVYNPETWVFKISWLHRAGVHILSWANSISIKKNAMLSQLDYKHATKGQRTSSLTFAQRNNLKMLLLYWIFQWLGWHPTVWSTITYFFCLPSIIFESGGRFGRGSSHLMVVTKNAAENEVLHILPSKAFTDLCSGLWVDPLFSLILIYII
jgi:hypothetical protein